MKTMQHHEIAPAKAKAIKDPFVKLAKDARSYHLEEKYDGWRFLIHCGGGLDRTYMTGRRISSKTGKFSEKGLCAPNLHAPKWMQKLAYTVVDGEVLPPKGRTFRDIAGIMNVEPEDAALRIKEIGPPRFVAFDVLFFNGVDLRGLPQRARTQHVAGLFNTASRMPWEQAEIHVSDFAATLEKHYNHVIDHGGEGVILKDADAPYGKGWIKVKKMTTLDVICTGFTDAKHGITGKYDGLIGAVEVSVYEGQGSVKNLVEVGQVSGMSDEMRMDITKNKKKYLGQVLEVKAQEMASAGRLRHPRFARWRPEADAKHATMKKLLTDLAAGSKEKE